jgi:RNA recognition motif-containing protein
MDVKLYVGNLSYDTSEDDLRTLFSEAGVVSSVTMVKDRITGQSKGFAFVEMGSQSEAEQAIKLFDGFSLSNRKLKVDKARPREERPFNRYDDDKGQGRRRDRNRRGGSGKTRRY